MIYPQSPALLSAGLFVYNKRNDKLPLMTHILRFMFRTRVGTAAAFGALLLFVCIGIGMPVDVFAQVDTGAMQDVASSARLSQENIVVIIANLIRVFLGVLGIIITCLILYGGFLYMTSGGEPDKTKKAKMVIQNAVIGLVITMSSFAIASFILNSLTDALGIGGTSGSAAAAYSEPLSGSLGAGIIEDHYPMRNALAIPRNTRIMVTFKEPIQPESLIEGYDEDTNPGATDLNTETVHIYQTAQLTEGVNVADISLTSSGVVVGYNDDFTIFVFDPVELLGSATEDTNYTVSIGSGLRKANGSAAFTGAYADGYEWDFEVSTEVDNTPPTISSIIPSASDDAYARNISVSLTFSEAMDPIASTGTYADGSGFTNITVVDADGNTVDGTYEISNGYRTVDFTPTDACGQDPCGDTIYCLPGLEDLTVTAKAAELGDEPPAAVAIGASFNGLVDASANSLDGNDDGTAQGIIGDNSEDPDAEDHYAWDFSTTDEIEDDVPVISDISPGILGSNADTLQDVTVTFNMPMKASTLTSSNIQLWPDPWYEFWFRAGSTNFTASDAEAELSDTVAYTQAYLEHPELVSSEVEGWDYYPTITKDVKSAYQICMFPVGGPSSGTDTGSCATTDANPYCCNGMAQATECLTQSGADLPDTESAN